MKSGKQLPLLALIAMGTYLTAARSGDVLTELGIEISQLEQDVLTNLKETEGFSFYAPYSIRQTARRIPASAQTATVQALGRVVRAYIESSAFKQDWLQDLRSEYPYDDSSGAAFVAQQEAAAQGTLQQNVAAMEQAFAHMDPAMLQMMAKTQLVQQEAGLTTLTGAARTSQVQAVAHLKKILSLPPAEFKKLYVALLKQQTQSQMDQFNNSLQDHKEQAAQECKRKAEFDAHADFRPLLKKRLQDFIALTNTVDFETRLVPMGRKQEFANPVYQHKPAEWKFLYRMGKEPVAAARMFAQQWLADLH